MSKRKVIGLPGQGQEREKHDFYATHPSAIQPLLRLLKWEDGGKLIWENSCGKGHLSTTLQLYGHTVISTDLIDRGYGIPHVDFLKDTWLHSQRYDAIIMNPPYKYALEFVQRSLTIAPVVCAFLRIQFLETPKRKKFFSINPPKYVAVFSSRVKSSKDGLFPKGESSTVCYAWFIWEKDYKGETVIKWL